jgi:hypothetical protein
MKFQNVKSMVFLLEGDFFRVLIIYSDWKVKITHVSMYKISLLPLHSISHVTTLLNIIQMVASGRVITI